MNTSDHTSSNPETHTPGRAEYPGMFNHMFLGPDTRSLEERCEADRKERARRTGRRSKDWWLKSTLA